jgi:hypothetical protein
VVGEVFIDKHLLARNGVPDSPEVRAVGELWLKSKSIVVLWLKEALQDVFLLVGGGKIDVSVLSVLQDLFDNVVSAGSSLQAGADKAVGI